MTVETNRKKAEFIKDMYHEIRTPLNIISGFAQVLSASIESIPDEDVEDITARMKQSAGDISRLTRELSEAAKPTNTI
jgi:sigma-B regulation protein RsbU (phosphoserine phosphatase)